MPQQSRSTQTRNQILDTAMHCFAESGYEATGVAEICQRAGVSKGAFYYHFDSKRAVFLEILNRWLASLEEDLSLIDQEPASISERLLKMSHIIKHILNSNSLHMPILLEFWTQASRDAAIREVTAAPYRKFQDFFETMINEGIREGSLREVDARVAAQAIVALASGLVLQGILMPQSVQDDWDKVVEESLCLILPELRGRKRDTEIH